MDVADGYNEWAAQYDTNKNRTRDLEGVALRNTLGTRRYHRALELGCGTGKNTEFLASIADNVLGVDFSEGMLAKAQAKITVPNVRFQQADLQLPWHFGTGFDLVTFSLVLEHIEDLDAIFAKVSQVLAPGGTVYIGELHPFKQYAGTKARFTTATGVQELTCFTHHTSDFVAAASANGFTLVSLTEHFDDGDRNSLPRLLVLVFRK